MFHNTVPANRPDLIGIVLSFEFQNLNKSGHSSFQEEKEKTFSFVKICSAGDH